MANPTVPRASKTCQHVGCHKVYRPVRNHARQKYCSHACAVAARPRLSRVLAGRKAGATKRRQRSERLPYIKAAEYRRGFSDGYEQAIRELDATYARAMRAVEAREAA